MLRSARAMRPCLPMTLPTSSGATWRWKTIESSRSSVSTRTASGSSTSPRASHSRSSAIDAGGLDEPRDRIRRPGALRHPVLDLRLVEVDRGRVGLRVVAPDDLDEASVARRAGVRDDDPVDRVLLRPDARQPDLHCHLSVRAFLFVERKG